MSLNVFFAHGILFFFTLLHNVLHLYHLSWLMHFHFDCSVSSLVANLSILSFLLHPQLHLFSFGHLTCWLLIGLFFRLLVLTLTAHLSSNFRLYVIEPLHLPFFLWLNCIILDLFLHFSFTFTHLSHVLLMVVLWKHFLGFRG